MQNLNLYQRPRLRRPGPSPRNMLQATLALLLLGTLHAAWQAWQLHAMSRQLAETERAAQEQEQRLGDERSAFREPQHNPSLPAELVASQEQNLQLQRLLDHVRLLGDLHQKGFADALAALAEQHPAQGLWLTRIVLGEGGRQLQLSGQARAQELVPAYLQALGRAPVFAGREFARFSVRREQEGVFAFELSSYPAELEAQP